MLRESWRGESSNWRGELNMRYHAVGVSVMAGVEAMKVIAVGMGAVTVN